MSRIYDNWERLVTATLRREDLRLICERTPSDLSSVSSSPSRFSLSTSSQRVSSFNSHSSFLVVGESQSHSFTYHQIVRATNYLNDSNLIKRGHSGDLFYGVLEGGTQVVVKKVDLSSVKKSSLFRSELKFHGMVSHSRLVPLLGHCLEKRNEKFMVYKYMPYKDLSSSLLGEIVSHDGSRSPSLNWITRLKIAIGAAESLSYLHHECVPSLVHSDIQASSILLDDNFEVRLGSLCELHVEREDINQNTNFKLPWLPKGSEQETSGISNASRAFDVYCFGKVLLELVTGKLGFSAANDSTVTDRIANLLAYIVPDNQELILNIMDPSLITHKHVLMEIWGVAFVAKACLSPKSLNRPQMMHVLSALGHIESARLSNYRYTQRTGQLVSVDQAMVITNILEGSKIIGRTLQAATNMKTSSRRTASRNEGISEARGSEEDYPNGEIMDSPSLMILSCSELTEAAINFAIQTVAEKGEIGSVYRAWLQETSTSNSSRGRLIAVSQHYSQNKLLLKKWQSQATMLGRLSHPNLVKIFGHFLEDKQLFLVHEFLQYGSLENRLFKSSAAQPLSWEIRLKILIGAARGLAFLHASKEQGFYEYFEPSDILLDSSYNAKILGFGIAKKARPSAFSDVHPRFCYKARRVYTAPEYIITTDSPAGFMYMKGDVYGFGVVLFEMLTGLSAKGQYHLKTLGRNCFVEFFRFHLSDGRQFKKIIDSRLEGQYTTEAALQVVQIALKCLDTEPKARPSMKEVVEELERIESAK